MWILVGPDYRALSLSGCGIKDNSIIALSHKGTVSMYSVNLISLPLGHHLAVMEEPMVFYYYTSPTSNPLATSRNQFVASPHSYSQADKFDEDRFSTPVENLNPVSKERSARNVIQQLP